MFSYILFIGWKLSLAKKIWISKEEKDLDLKLKKKKIKIIQKFIRKVPASDYFHNFGIRTDILQPGLKYF